jgi:hypothetical protein
MIEEEGMVEEEGIIAVLKVKQCDWSLKIEEKIEERQKEEKAGWRFFPASVEASDENSSDSELLSNTA